jgi:glutamate-1-semialdehyde 2,1-aminomutase
LDDNKYIDLVNCLAAVTVGYGYKPIERAVFKQLRRGVSYSLPGTLESEISEMIVSLVPSAEMVRFGKNGSDATSAAIRLARAYTGRDEIIVCGYHGWQDWYIGSTSRNKGVPKSVADLTHKFIYNDVASLQKVFTNRKNRIAAVIMEPMNSEWPNPNFLKNVKDITNKEGAVLVFDETITGFRFSPGGAQELFNITPDLSTFGKGIANGFPLSAVVGRRDIMVLMEEVFYSGTFGGELLSLAAAKKVLELHKNNEICDELAETGQFISDAIELMIQKNGLKEILSISGHPSWKFLNWKGTEKYSLEFIKTYFMQEMFNLGILVTGTHNISTAISGKEVRKILSAYEEVLQSLSTALVNNNMEEKLLVPPLKPLFKIR